MNTHIVNSQLTGSHIREIFIYVYLCMLEKVVIPSIVMQFIEQTNSTR